MESFAFQFILTTTLVLVAITLYLFASSVLVRNAHRREEYYFDKKRDELYPFILGYMMEEIDSLDDLSKTLRNKEDISALLTIMYEIMDSVEGDEVNRLRHILAIDRIRKNSLRLLKSSRNTDQLQACAYYSRLGTFTDEELSHFKKFLFSDKLMLAHTAATSIMTLQDVEQRYFALITILGRQRISRMAVLDLIYQFHNRSHDQMDDEAEKLLELIHNRTLPPDNVAVVIKAICEIGYVTIAMELFEMLESGYWDNAPIITESLIYAVGRFELGFTADSIAERYLSDPRTHIRRAAVETLERFNDEELLPLFEQSAKDPEFVVRLKSIYALAAFGELAKPILDKLASETDEMRNLIRGVVAEVGG